jgi:hypothetical protein
LENQVLANGISKFIDGFNNNINIVCKECGLEVYTTEKLKEFIHKQGIIQFLRTYNNPVLFRIYSSALNLNEDQEPSVGGLEDILDEIVLQGMHSWLNKFPKPLLEAWCSDLSIQYTQRSDLVDRIMTKIFSLQQLEDDVNLSIIPITSSQNEDKKEKKPPSKNKHEDSSAGEKRSSKKKQPKRKLEEGSNESKKEKSKKRRSKESSDESESEEKRDRHSRKRKEEDSESRKSKSPRKKTPLRQSN